MSATSSPHQAQLAPGTSLQDGKYRILSVLGQGGFGITYLAEHRSFGKVALKELFLSSGTANCSRDSTTSRHVVPQFDREQFEQFKTRFYNEARTLYALNDIEGVVKVLDIFEENDTVYFSMEFIDGEKLDEYALKRGKNGHTEGVKLINAVGTTLAKVHARGLLHRDVKPSNVIVAKSGRIVLIDFGIARNYDADMPETHTTFHSPRYSPPEQKNAKARMDTYSDVYALAATAYFVFTLHPPQTIEERIIEDYLPPQHFDPMLPDAINDAINDALKIKPTERTQTVDAFLSAMNGDAPTPQYQPSVTEPILTNPLIIQNPDSEVTRIEEPSLDAHTLVDLPTNDANTLILPTEKPTRNPRKPLLITAFQWQMMGGVAAGLLLATVAVFWASSKTDAPTVANPTPESVTTVAATTPTPVTDSFPMPSTPVSIASVDKPKATAQNDKKKGKKGGNIEKTTSAEPIITRTTVEVERLPQVTQSDWLPVCENDGKYIVYEIYNASGNLMVRNDLKNQQTVKIDFLAAGTYTLKCVRGSETVCQKKFTKK